MSQYMCMYIYIYIHKHIYIYMQKLYTHRELIIICIYACIYIYMCIGAPSETQTSFSKTAY